ncbi:MAG: prolipoprotein diacylglyceryl transferase [Limnohabitans sp.]|nr:prolipoprotein diacylglyceryl transferase [Limnohabitans sp.]
MLTHPQFNPVALSLDPLSVHWYGITYMVAFLLFMLLARLRLHHLPWADLQIQGKWGVQQAEDLLFYGVLGVVLGGRVGYCLFYKFGYYASHPLEIFYVWQGGMSFHGGMLGVILAMFLYAHRQGLPWLQVTDFIAPCVPTGLAAGRVGNFINGELWGREADPALPWAMIFPQSGSMIPRHPSQIYQFLLEGLLLFVVLWLIARKPQPTGYISGVFLFGYGCLRFLAEYFREPDAHLGLLSAGLSMGQWLCVPMILIGIWLVWKSHHQTRVYQ